MFIVSCMHLCYASVLLRLLLKTLSDILLRNTGELIMWRFLSRGRGETEGYSNGSLAEFKGNPLQALAREVCQNSLDAADGSGKPVIVEFQTSFIDIASFPGMKSMKDVISACDKFWRGKGDINTLTFLNNAKECFKSSSGKFYVLRISDYNTTGVTGAFSKEDITPWGSLVKGNSFSVKLDEKNSAGSYGIGKAAPFVSSAFQTVFYRTYDQEGIRAALGVARLMAHESIVPVPKSEDPVRRSVGYYGEDPSGYPAISFAELDALNKRESYGTDLFIPGFTGPTLADRWVKDVLKEIVENFLYSIYSGRLEIRIKKIALTKNNLKDVLDWIGSKDAKIFYEVIRNNPNVIEITRRFYNLGNLRLRLLYGNDLNKKVLVVRNSGMKIARISSLPRMISYTGFLELQGSDLNQYFRSMENPSHNAWEPKRHSDPKTARKYKEEVESWVIEKITEKLIELSGEESTIDVGDCFNSSNSGGIPSDSRKVETINDETQSLETETYIPQVPAGKKISIRDEGKVRNTKSVAGREDPDGSSTGYRHRTGKKPGGKPTGRKVTKDPTGQDTVNVGEGGNPHEVPISARIISQGNGVNKLIFIADEDISLGRIEIVTRGENGRSMRLNVKAVTGNACFAEHGTIVLRDIPANSKQTLQFVLSDKHNYAMGVKAYGD